MTSPFVHPTAEVSADASLGADVAVWNWSKVREGARIGERTRIGQGVYVDEGVEIGSECKIQNGVSLYRGVRVGNAVFIGPSATFTNDRVPRAFTADWQITPTVVDDYASVGANATIVCGVTIGRAAMVGAGAVVTADVPPHALVIGNPARVVDYVRLDGSRLRLAPGEAPPDDLAMGTP